MMTFAELTTPGGYRAGEVASAMQKCIRRGLANDALFWATELDLAGYPEYVWKRLKIIASEDVGLASNDAAPTISALYQSWLEQRSLSVDLLASPGHTVFHFPAEGFTTQIGDDRFTAFRKLSVGIGFSKENAATCARACTPASVRPACWTGSVSRSSTITGS